MTAWQKRARLGLALIGVLVIVLVAVSVRKGPPAAANETVQRVDPKAVSESSGVRLTQSTGLKVPGVVDAERTLLYEDGSMKLIGPKVTTDRAGRQFVITGKEGRIGRDQSRVTMKGDVKLASSDGLTAEAREASFNRAEGIVRAPGPVSFTKGAIAGTSVGMTFDQNRDVLWLLDQAHVKVAPGQKSGGGADVTAGAAGYARRDKYMRFERSVRLLREDRTIEADNAMAYLTDDESRVESLELRGHSRIAVKGAAEGGLQQMASDEMNLRYGPDGETLEHALLSGDAVIQIAGTGGAPGRRIAGRYVDITFGAGGELSAMVARDRVELTLPAAKDTPARAIKSATMEGTGEPGKGLTASRFEGGVEFREQSAPDRVRIARARTLEIAMAPGSGEIEEARFSGSTRLEDGALRASAANGRYQIGKGVLELTGSEGPNDPRVRNERLTVDARRIDLTFEGTRLVATGEVRSVIAPAPKSADPKASKDHVPGMLKNDQPVNVTSASLDYEGSRSFATYTGNARLWQADTTIQGETIVIDETTGDLKASSPEGSVVRSAFTLEQVDQKTNQPTKVPSVASGQTMHYEDALHRATYTTNAHVNGPQGDLHARKIELYFVESGGSLDRAEGYEQVKLLSEGRNATGSRMTYFAADERYLMSGAPVTIIEECRVTTGKTLTFFRSTDRIIVDGNEEIRTLTRNNPSSAAATCSQARPQ
jgi:LPS export ABC transporter protein LptC/lipopolysaccharide transport protein LptA